MTIAVSAFTARLRRGIVAPLLALALLAIDFAVLALTFRLCSGTALSRPAGLRLVALCCCGSAISCWGVASSHSDARRTNDPRCA